MTANNNEINWKTLTEKYLELNLYDAARFYAERLYYEKPTHETIYLLALCYFRQNKLKQAYLILQDSKFEGDSLPNKYLLALCCVGLSKYDEAEAVLHPNLRYQALNTITKDSMATIPGGSAGVFLLGKVSRRQQRLEAAVHYYKIALEMDPFLWSAIMELSEMGEDVGLFNVSIENDENTKPNRVTRNSSKKEKSNNFSTKNNFLDNESSKQILLTAAERLAARNDETPMSSNPLEISAMSFRMPFASPGSMPSPITKSMLSVGPMHVTDQVSPLDVSSYSHYNINKSMTPHTDLLIHELTSRGGGGSSLDINPRGALFGLPTPIESSVRDDRDLLLTDSIVESNTAMNKQSNRRVSFGPTARLSFSGAFEAHALDQSTDQASKVASAEEEHPHKFIRKDPSMVAISESPEISKISRHSITLDGIPSPFPMSTSPLPRTNQSMKLMEQSSISRPFDNESSFEEMDDLQKTNPNQSFLSQASTVKATPHIPFNYQPSTPNTTEENLPQLYTVLNTFIQAIQALYNYQCVQCIELLQTLPQNHFRSGYVSHLVGKACTEMNEYKGAALAFREMIRLEPFRLQGLEIFSSTLWHLREAKDLAALSKQVVDIDKFSPETWCVVGNCFSLQKEPETAVRFFERAIQIDPFFTYAYTLSGHEHVNSENIEKAITLFRQALLHNPRHYNAWYGLGSIYYRQERFELSEYHFRKAHEINSNSSVLDCYLAMALYAQGSDEKTSDALKVLSKAIDRDPNNPQLRFQKAHILFGLDVLEQALEELLIVEHYAPKEPPVHAMLGQLYQQLGNVPEALMHLNIALELDPKEANAIRAVMDNFAEPVVDI